MKTKADPIGILGGLGPKASAHFLESIYSKEITFEQQAPSVILFSLPQVQDRSQAINDSRTSKRLLKEICPQLNRLVQCGVSEIIIACFTLHSLWEFIPMNLRKHIVNLPRFTVGLMAMSPGKKIILGTNGFRRSKILEKQENWNQVSDRALYPTESDQIKIHDLIYQIKRNGPDREIAKSLRSIAGRYSNSAVLACSELSMIASHLRELGLQTTDPLSALVKSKFHEGPGIYPVCGNREHQELIKLRDIAYASCGKRSVNGPSLSDPHDRTGIVLVAKENGRIVGSVRVNAPISPKQSYLVKTSRRDDLPISYGRASEVSRLCSTPSIQGHGIATRLVSAAIDISDNCNRPEIVFSAAGKLRSTYTAYGARPTGIIYGNPALRNIPHEVLVGQASVWKKRMQPLMNASSSRTR